MPTKNEKIQESTMPEKNNSLKKRQKNKSPWVVGFVGVVGVIIAILSLFFLKDTDYGSFTSPMVQTAYSKPVTLITPINDGKYTLSADYKELKIHDSSSWAELLSMKKQFKIAVSPSGQFFALGYKNGDVKFYDSQFLEVINTGQVSKKITCMAFSKDDQYLAIGLEGGMIEVRDAAEFTLLNSFGTDQKGRRINSIDFNENSTALACSIAYEKNPLIRIFRLDTPETPIILTGSPTEISTVKFIGGDTLISGSGNKIFFWNVETRKISGVIENPNRICRFVVNHDFSFLASFSKDIYVYNLKTKKQVSKIANSKRGSFYFSAGFSSNNELLLAGVDKGIEIINTKDWKRKTVSTLMQDKIDCLAISKDGKYGVVGVSNSRLNSIKVWDFSTGKLLSSMPYGVHSYGKAIRRIAVSDSNRFVAASTGYSIKLFCLNNGDEFKNKVILSKDDFIFGMTFTPDEKHLLYASKNKKGINVYSLNNEEHKASHFKGKIEFEKTLKFGDHDCFQIVALKDNDTILATVGSNIEFWSLKEQKKLATLVGHKGLVRSIHADKENKLLVSVSNDGKVKLWDIKNRKFLKDIYTTEKRKVFTAQFSKDSQRIVITGKNKDTKIYSRDTDKIIRIIPVSSYYATFLDNDKKLVVIDRFNGSVNIHNTNSGNNIVKLYSFKNDNWVAMSNCGYFNGTSKALSTIYLTKKTNDGVYNISSLLLYEELYRPEIIKSILSGDNVDNAPVYGELLRHLPPKAVFTKVNNNNITKKGFDYGIISSHSKDCTLSFGVSETDDGGIGTINIYQNNKLISSLSGKKEKKVDVELIAGDNKISIECFNKDNTVHALRESISVQYDEPSAEKANLYAILIGANKHQNKDSAKPLEANKKDALNFKSTLSEYAKDLYRNVYITLLTDEYATKRNIYNAIDEVSQDARRKDVILFFIATHGGIHKNQLLLTPYNNNSVSNYIEFKEIFRRMQQNKALSQIFILNTCHAGKGLELFDKFDSSASRLAKHYGVHTLFSSKDTEYSWTNFFDGGFFTNKVLKNLMSAGTDTNNDHVISVLELSKSLLDIITIDYDNTQTPVIRNFGSDIELTVPPSSNKIATSTEDFYDIEFFRFSHSGKYIIAGGEGCVYLLNAKDLSLYQSVDIPISTIKDCRLIKNDKLLIVHTYKGIIAYDLDSFKRIIHQKGYYKYFGVTLEGSCMAFKASGTGKVYVYDLDKMKTVNSYNLEKVRCITSDKDNIYITAYDDDDMAVYDAVLFQKIDKDPMWSLYAYDLSKGIKICKENNIAKYSYIDAGYYDDDNLAIVRPEKDKIVIKKGEKTIFVPTKKPYCKNNKLSSDLNSFVVYDNRRISLYRVQ